jgi:hypothetical protein
MEAHRQQTQAQSRGHSNGCSLSPKSERDKARGYNRPREVTYSVLEHPHGRAEIAAVSHPSRGAQECAEIFHEKHETHFVNRRRAEAEAQIKGARRSVNRLHQDRAYAHGLRRLLGS